MLITLKYLISRTFIFIHNVALVLFGTHLLHSSSWNSIQFWCQFLTVIVSLLHSRSYQDTYPLLFLNTDNKKKLSKTSCINVFQNHKYYGPRWGHKKYTSKCQSLLKTGSKIAPIILTQYSLPCIITYF